MNSETNWEPVEMDPSHGFADSSLTDLGFGFDVNMADLLDFSGILPPMSDISMGQKAQAKRKTRMRASKACIGCRSKHIKCDSKEPVCSRCELDKRECVYLKSRRGGSSSKADVPRAISTSHDSNASTPSLVADGPSTAPSIDSVPEFQDECLCGDQQRETLLSAYFDFFHNAHPIVLPRNHLVTLLQSDPDSFECLIPVLEYIGSIYLPNISSSPFQQAAQEKLDVELPNTAVSVQALLLFALARHCCDELEIANRYADRAIEIALYIRMNTQRFATENGESNPVLEESWRRTWWTLYCVDALFIAINHDATHRQKNLASNVDLPCEDWEYESGNIPTPKTLEDYDNREFAEDEIVFSSMTYLIDCMRGGSSVTGFKLYSHQPNEKELKSADAKFVNWALYLPLCKQELVREDHKVDETMFLAHLVMNVENLLLHRPYSRLQYSLIERRSKCTHPSPTWQSKAAQREIALHTAKCLEAIETSINLFALPTPYLKHSPLITCALALVIMGQVSACNHVLVKGSESAVTGRDRVRLGLGALRAGEIWGMAKRSVAEVSGVARDLLLGAKTSADE